LNSIYNFELYVVLVQSEVFRDRLAKLSFKSHFEIISNGETSTAKIIYNAFRGQLFYNPDSSAAGFGSGGVFATLIGAPTLSASDFVVQ
ncbi:MAG: hypothetical protein V7K89_26275, partial [Nostoc sp.]